MVKIKLKMKIIILNLGVCFTLIVNCLADAKIDFEWPAEMEVTFKKLLEVKRESIRNKGVQDQTAATKLFDQSLDKLYSQMIASKTAPKISELNEATIRGKLALWAVGRHKSPHLYERIDSLYITFPYAKGFRKDEFIKKYADEGNLNNDPFEDQGGYAGHIYNLSKSHYPEIGWYQKKDIVELNRLIFEYYLYSPNRNFTYWDCNYALSSALLEIDNDNTITLFDQLAEEVFLSNAILAKVANTREKPEINFGLHGLIGMPNNKSYKSIARLWGLGGEENIKKSMRDSFGAHPTSVKEFYAQERKSHGAWLLLAKKEWETTEEEELALWIKSQKLWPFLHKEPKGATDPLDPF